MRLNARVSVLSAKRLNISVSLSKSSTPFFKDAPHDAKPLWFMAESIRLMADADLVYFAKGWKDARGCMIERECAVQYGVPILEPDY